MNRKKYMIATTAALSTALLAFAGSLHHHLSSAPTAGDVPVNAALSGPAGKFGPIVEAFLPAPKREESITMLDLETGRARIEPSADYFDWRADAMLAWTRSHGLDIACFLLSRGAACVTYDMTIVAVGQKNWEETTAEQLIANPALRPVLHAPRRLLVLGDQRPDTYMFRTGEGNLGLLRIVGTGEHGDGVKIQYKLIKTAGNSVAKLSANHS